MRLLFASIAAASLMFAATPLVAQGAVVPTGSHIGRPAPADVPPSSALSNEDRALRTVFEYARCIVQRHEDDFRPILSLSKVTPSTDDQRQKMRDRRCLASGRLQIPPTVFRGALHREFYLMDFKAEPISDFGPEVNYWARFDSENKSLADFATLLDFASCVIRTDQESARNFVVNPPGDPRSDEALSKLVPILGPCMREGSNVEFSKSILSAYLAEALYWETEASRNLAAVSEAAE